MGSIMAETTSAEKVEHIIKPVKDLFGAVFFVSVGMMIDPAAIVEYRWPVLWITLLTLFGKLFSTTIGALVSGQPLKQSVQVGMSMAQIGEFAFIVATLGLSLGVISDFLFPIVVGASAVTTFTTPYMIRFSEPVYNFILRVLPQKMIIRLNNYSSGTQHIQAESNWKSVLKSYVNITVTNGIVLLALLLLALNFLIPFLKENISEPLVRNLAGLVITLGISAPFLWALMAKKPNGTAYKELWLVNKYNRGPLLMIEIARNVVGLLLIGFWVNMFFPARIALLIAVPVIIIVLLLFSKGIQNFYQRIEGRFLSNLNARERLEKEKMEFQKRFDPKSDLSPWDAHMIDLEVNPHSEYIGKTLAEIAWREQYGINLAYIKRGDKLIYAPGRNNRLLPFDHVGVIATDDQMQLFKPVFDATENVEKTDQHLDDITLQKIVVDEHNQLKDLSIRSSHIRERTNGLVVGIERNKERILNPDSTEIFHWGDIVWIVGERKKIQKLNSF
jgi:CPA2 family monovalent cation:H+ antiporter-2